MLEPPIAARIRRADHRTGPLLGNWLWTVAVDAAVPYLTELTRLAHEDGVRGVITTGVASDHGGSYDFVSRFFAPGQGIPEDPVT